MKNKILALVLILLSCSRSGERIPLKPIESWLGAYLAQEKIGYSLFKLQAITKGYQISSRTKMSMNMMGQASEIVSNFNCVTDTELFLKSFDMDFVSKQSSFRALGKIIDSKLEITIKSGGETKSSVVDMPEKVYPAAILGNVAASQGLAAGKEYRLKIFEPIVMQIVEVKVVIEKKEEVQLQL